MTRLARLWCILLTLMTLFATTGPAAASPYAFGHNFSTDACDVGYGDVCKFDTGTDRWTCDTSLIGGSSTTSVSAKVVYDHSSGGTLCDGDDYCAFGTDGTDTFYCKLTESTLVEVVLIGGDNVDTLAFTHEQSSERFDLREHTTANLHGEIQGGDASDYIEGSYRANLTYHETLRGEGGDDQTIYGNAGDDIIYGGPGHDLISGGLGDDRIYGDDGNDDINGDGGDDTIYGGAGADEIAGSGGQDAIYGGSQADTLCGDDEADLLDGGAHDDVLWGGLGTDTGTGGLGSDACNTSGEFGCTSDPGPTRPAACTADTGDTNGH